MTLTPRLSHALHARLAIAALGAVALVGAIGTSPAQAAATGRIRGDVVSWATGAAVRGASITLPALGLRAVSDARGTFSFPTAIPVAAGLRRMDVVAAAPGFGRWTIRGVPLWAGDALVLHVELRARPWTHRVLSPQERAAASPGPSTPDQPTAETCTGWDDQFVPPQDIWVYVTPDKKAEHFDLTYYAAHVLPDEWIASWDADSLGAGAVAVKTYAAYRAETGHARTSGAGCYDILDTTSDQVFDPSWSTEATDEAVDATMGSILWQNGAIFMSHYFAGAKGDPCAAVQGQYAGWMSQWGTQTCATSPNNELWPAIVETFYANTAWHFENNFLLNPNATSTTTYPWGMWAATLGRTNSGGYHGGWSWTVANTTTWRWGQVYQDRPFPVGPDTTAHQSVALACPTSNTGTCSYRFKLVTYTAGGSSYEQTSTFTETNDAKWRTFTYDPPALGIDGVTLRFSVASKQDFDLDAAYLDSPFGGS